MGDDSLRVFIVAGEQSGDHLGAELMASLRTQSQKPIHFDGVGGTAMQANGMTSLFDMEDIAVMGFSAVVARLPKILKRISQTAKAAIAFKPDLVIIIDSPDFTHRVAAKIKKAVPKTPVVDFICPSVWAWRPGRAKKMAAYIDHVLAILPFEPDVLKDLQGPDATYVGHPLVSKIPSQDHNLDAEGKRTLLVLPGSRAGEVSRLLPAFEEVLNQLHEMRGDFDIIIPAVAHVEKMIVDATADWKHKPHIVSGDDEKLGTFSKADAALAASGTVCLELALAGVPMVSTYKLDPVARQLRFLVTVWTANLPNLIVDYPIIPEYIDEYLRPGLVARALNRLLDDTPERRSQLEAFRDLRTIMTSASRQSPADQAAQIVLDLHQHMNAR